MSFIEYFQFAELIVLTSIWFNKDSFAAGILSSVTHWSLGSFIPAIQFPNFARAAVNKMPLVSRDQTSFIFNSWIFN